jgi:hypothetical protein
MSLSKGIAYILQPVQSKSIQGQVILGDETPPITRGASVFKGTVLEPGSIAKRHDAMG